MNVPRRKTLPSTPADPKPVHDRRGRDLAIALWLGLALFFFYLFSTSAHQPTGDEEEYIAVAASLITTGSPAVTKVEPTANGRNQVVKTYFKYPLGHSLMLLPIVALQMIADRLMSIAFGFVPHLVLNAFPALLSAAMSALVFLLITASGRAHPELSVSRFTAALIALATGLATQLWPASRTFFADNSVALLLTLAIYALVKFRHESAGIGWAVLSAGAAAMMVFCKTLLIVACPALAAYGLWVASEQVKSGRLSKRSLNKLVILSALPFFILVAVQLWHNDLRYGSIWVSGYHEGRDGSFGFATPIWVGLYGIFFSSGRGFFFYSPLCLLGLLGAREFYKHAPAEFFLTLGVSVPVILTYAMWWSWHGGWEWGTRFYIFLIPLLMWMSVTAWRWIDRTDLSAKARRTRLILLAALVAVSLFVQLLGNLIHPIAYWRMTGSDLRVLEHPMYQKSDWEIRDDMPFAHFVPEFSPIAAHVWLIWATWNRHTLGEQALANRAPWTSLNPKWAPTNVKDYLGYDVWFVGDWVKPWLGRGGSLTSLVLVAIALAILSAFSVRKLLLFFRQPDASTMPISHSRKR